MIFVVTGFQDFVKSWGKSTMKITKSLANFKLMVLEDYWELSAGVETGVGYRLKVLLLYLGAALCPLDRKDIEGSRGHP